MSFTKSKIFLYFCLSFALGIFIASFLQIPDLALFAAAIIAVIFISIFWRNIKIAATCFAIIFVALGVYRYQMVSKSDNSASIHSDLNKNIIFLGVIVEEPDVRIKNTQYIIQATETINTGLPRPAAAELAMTEKKETSLGKDSGKILATMPHYPAYKYGDLVEFEGKLKVPEKFNSFDYREYLAKDDIYFTMYNPKTDFISPDNGNFVYRAIFSFKNAFKEKLGRLLPEPEISLLNGLLLGERSGMDEKLKNDFAITGTSHIVAVSGFNVTIIAVLILEFCLFLGFSRGQAFWVSLLAIISFIIMVGAPASAIRAGIMGGLVMAAMRAGRLNSVTTAIVFAAVLMIAANPKILRFDIGFQLSFLAVMGLVWVYPILDYYSKKIPDILKTKSMLLITISAQVMALPILIYNFDRLSIVSPLANILILPFVPLAMAIGFLAGVFSFVWMMPAEIMGYFTWLVLAYQIRAIEFLASFSRSSIKIFNFSVELFFIYYIILVIIIINFWSKKRTVRIF